MTFSLALIYGSHFSHYVDSLHVMLMYVIYYLIGMNKANKKVLKVVCFV